MCLVPLLPRRRCRPLCGRLPTFLCSILSHSFRNETRDLSFLDTIMFLRRIHASSAPNPLIDFLEVPTMFEPIMVLFFVTFSFHAHL